MVPYISNFLKELIVLRLQQFSITLPLSFFHLQSISIDSFLVKLALKVLFSFYTLLVLTSHNSRRGFQPFLVRKDSTTSS